MQKKSIFMQASAFSIVLLSILAFIFTKNQAHSPEIVFLTPSYAFDVDNLNEVVGFGNYVFIGYVEKMTGTSYDASLPRTCFDVTVIANIKGSLPKETVKVQKSGGLTKDSSQILLFQNDSIPKENAFYVFTVRDSDGDGIYVASGPNTTALIHDIPLPENADILADRSSSETLMQEVFQDSNIVQNYIAAYRNEIPPAY